MTATTYHCQNRSPLPWVIFAVVLIGAAAMVLPAVIERAHADKHTEAAAIRACWEKGDILQRWVKVNLKAGLQRDYCLFELPDQTIGCRIVQLCKSFGWLEISAFRLGDGTIQTAEEYLKSNNCTIVWPSE